MYSIVKATMSPNFTANKNVKSVFGHSRTIKTITIHHWGKEGQKFNNVLTWFQNPDARTSAHYVVEDGKVACMVDPENAAWHAGSAEGNATSIGIELRPEATEGDYRTAAELIRDLRKTYGNLPLVPHKSWKSTECPGKWDLDELEQRVRELDSDSKSTTLSEGIYVVKKGDTLYRISNNFNMTTLELAKLNNIATTDTIYVGQEIKVMSHYHTVKKDETLYSIGKLYGTTPARLAGLNGLGDFNTAIIYIGQKLRIG